MIRFDRPDGERGIISMVALFSLMLLFALGMSFLFLASTSGTMSKRNVLRAQALNVAEAGAQQAISYLRDTAPDGSTDGTWRTTHPSANADVHEGDTWYEPSTPLSSTERFKLCVRDGTDVNAGNIVITSVGTVTVGRDSTSRTVKVVVVRAQENVSVWNNVIFGGVGQTGKSVNGNVVMRGSVHLLGDGEDYTDADGDGHWDSGETYTDANHNSQYDLGETYTDVDGDGHRDAREPFDDTNGNGTRDPALTVTDMAEEISGTADVGNNYDGMSAALKAKISVIPTKSFNGETVQSLSSKLRVKHGRVNISGSASVGYSNSPGGSPARKETLDGTYVSDGYGGNKGAGSVYADNGSASDYDLGDGVVKFPTMTAPYTDDNGIAYSSYQSYLQANATVVSGPLNLSNGTPLTISGAKGSLTMDASGNMIISGIVYVDGDINLLRNGAISYQGSGTLVSTGSVYVHCDLLPKTTFPTVDRIGMVARHRLELATGAGDSQLTMAGAFYAQEKVVSAKQSEIAGTLVGSYYELTNVPHIYQVPALTNNLPPGMPGNKNIYVVTVSARSWKEQ